MNESVLVALAPAGAEIDILGDTYDIPAMPAADWFALVLSDDTPFPLLQLLPAGAQFRVHVALVNGVLSVEEIAELSRKLLAAMSGMLWWEADRLIRSSASYWRVIGGELTRRGVNLHRESLAAVLNAIYVICTATMSAEERKRFDAELVAPPADAAPEDLAQVEQASLSAFAAALGPPPPDTPPPPR